MGKVKSKKQGSQGFFIYTYASLSSLLEGDRRREDVMSAPSNIKHNRRSASM